MEKYDVVIAGGGILGTALSYWISLNYEGRIAVLESEAEVAYHTSGRNTGVIHRPFYLDPERRKTFARSAQISYGLWKRYAAERRLPWSEIGTIEVATQEKEIKTVEKYYAWALKNGMTEAEVELLSPAAVRKLEPNVECAGAIFCKTDTSADFKAFTQALEQDSKACGTRFHFGFEIKSVSVEKEGLNIRSVGGETVHARFLVNCAGGNSIDILHLFGIGQEYTDLHFRGEYWEIDPAVADFAARNIYSVPKHAEIPFLDPHWIVRASGKREIGPNAVLVTGSKTYNGFFSNVSELAGKIAERPLRNKMNLFINPDFLKLASEEWMSSLSKKKMLSRVRRFLPRLKPEHLARRGTAGIRSSVIDAKGNFLKEAVEIPGPFSYHITNYNSPGATGSPAYTALLTQKLDREGYLQHLKKRLAPPKSLWNYQEILSAF